ncbi:nesprin-2 isoform X3 [Synchiropus splendidus]|uniref:nesprin-2 isoform X3 n=1 Tax=Synchiropus splendidus TaxID=270530 RepID=UPI00237DAE6A|nr:nesprin-2 isoform X3 [Synchiropus splendidus]
MTRPPSAGRQGRPQAAWTTVMDAPSPGRRPGDQEVVERMKSSVDERLNLLGEKLDAIITRPVDVSSSMEVQLGPDLEDLSDRLQKEVMLLSSGELSPCWRRGQRLGQRLERVQSALRCLGGLLAALRRVEAEQPALLPDSQAALEQRVRALVEQAEDADGRLRAAGMSVTLHGVDVDCCCLTIMSTRRLTDLISDEDTDQVFHSAEVEHSGADPRLPTRVCSPARRRDDDDDDGQRDITEGAMMGGDQVEQRVQRKSSLLTELEEIRGCAQDLQLQEATLPALQHRQRVLERLQQQLTDHLPEVKAVSDVPLQEGGTRALSLVWEEASRAVTDRLDQCSTLTELIKKFQSVSSKLRSALLRADSRVAEQKFYMSKENLEKMHSQVEESKAQLVSLVATIGDLRSTCRKLHTHLRQVPGCSVDPYEEEADALMDQWLDICEKTDCRLEILHSVLARWDNALQLGVELESRTHPEESLHVLQRELQTQEEIMRAFHRRLTEIQVLLQSSEPPLELQVAETQMLKEMQQLREFVCLQEKTVAQENEPMEREDEAADHQQQEEPRAEGTRPCWNLRGGSLAPLDPQLGSAEEQEKSSRRNSDTCRSESCCAPLTEEPNASVVGGYPRGRCARQAEAELPGDTRSEPGAGGGASAQPREGWASRLTPLGSGDPDVPAGSQLDRSLLEPSSREVQSSDLSATSSTIRVLVTSEELESLPPALEHYPSQHTSEMDILKAIDDALEEDEKLCFDAFVAGGHSPHWSSSASPAGRSPPPILPDQPGPSPPASCGLPGLTTAAACSERRAEETPGSTAPQKSGETMEDSEKCSEGLEETSSLDAPPSQSHADMDGERTQDSPGPRSCRHQLTMQDVWAGIPAVVESSGVLSRAPLLHSYPDETEVCLVRLVHKVLVCRYQPAQLDAVAMARQLKEAEELKSRVEQQAALMSSTCSVDQPVSVMEELLAAALLDASATVQVKAAQLDQVRRFHRQVRVTKAFLEVVSEEHQSSLASLESGAELADKLQALYQTMKAKKEIMEELRQLSGHLSIHLPSWERSGALFAKIGDVQEEWRCLEERLRRDLHQTLNCVRHASRLVSEAKQLQDRVEATQESIVSFSEPQEVRRCVDLAVTAGDLKLYQQQQLHLQAEAEALVRFSLDPKDKDGVEQLLRELASSLSCAKCNLHALPPSRLLSKPVLDLVRWLKQVEVQIWTGESMSLFPEEARLQITQMRQLQTDVWSRRSKLDVEVNGSDMREEDLEKALDRVADLFDAVTSSVDLVLVAMSSGLQEREELLCQLTGLEVWLDEAHAQRHSHAHLEDICELQTVELKHMLRSLTSAVSEIQMKLSLVEELESRSQGWMASLSLEESRHLVNRLSGLWTQLDRMLVFERATKWQVDELLRQRTTSDTDLAALEESLEKISTQMEQLKFPVTQETHLSIARLRQQLLEYQCQVQEVQHCLESRRSSLLRGIGELQDRCKALSVQAFEQEKYLQLRKHMESSRDRSREQMKRSREKQHSVGQRFHLSQTLLVELPAVKTLCQEAADQLEAISQDLEPLDLNSERQRIQRTVDTLVIRELSVTDDVRTLEAKLLLGLRFSTELSSLTEFFQQTRRELRDPDALRPDEEAIDAALRHCWILWRNMDSGMRVFEALGRKQKFKRSDFGELYALKEAAVLECQAQMESLSQARESLKDFQWAAQGAIAFLRDAEASFLSAHGGFLDCSQEHLETQRALQVLGEGFRSHMSHLEELVPRHPCLSPEETRQLHTSVLAQLVVGRSVLEAQAQLRLEALQRCKGHQEKHEISLQEVKQHLSGLEVKLSGCSGEHVTSLAEATTQHRRVQVLMEELSILAGKVEDLRAPCPMLGCGVGKDGARGVIWRHWMFLRHHVCLLMARMEHQREEWKDIQKSMEQSFSSLSGLQTELADSSNVRLSSEKPQKLLDEAERQQARLESEQRAVASLQHRLEQALHLSTPHDPGPARLTLQKLQEDVRSLKVKNMLVVAAAEAELKDQRQIEEKLTELERRVESRDPLGAQEVREAQAALKLMVDSSCRQLPSDIIRRRLALEQSLQQAEDEEIMRSGPVQELLGRVAELGSGLEDVKKLLELKSPSVIEAQGALKHVWDELDTCHNRLTLLESDVQDLVEDRPDQAHLFMDQLTQPLQLYQDVAKMAEQRTNFLSKIPACLQQLEDLQHSTTCWLEEAQSWISAPSSFTSARSLQNYGNALQLVLDDSERIRDDLQDFRTVLAEVWSVCDVTDEETRLDQSDQRVQTMQRSILEPLELLLQAAVLVEAMETELKTLERNVLKIQAILESVENPSIPPSEHLNNRQVILANLQSMRRTLEDMQSCRAELHLPPQAHESLQVFSRVEVLLQTLRELEQLTQDQVALLENQMVEDSRASSSGSLDALVETISEEDEDAEDDSCSSSSSDTLTCSLPEDPEETPCAVREDEAGMKTTSLVKESRGAACSSGSEDAAEGKQAAQSLTAQSGSEAQTGSQPEETLDTGGPVEQGEDMNPPGAEENPTHRGATSEPPASDPPVQREVDSPTDPGPEAAEVCPPPNFSGILHWSCFACGQDQGDEAMPAFCADEAEGLLEEPRRMERGSSEGDLLQLASTSDLTWDQPPAPGPTHHQSLTDWPCDVPQGEDQAALSSWLCAFSHLDGGENSLTEDLRLQWELDSGDEKVLLLEVSRSLLRGTVWLLELAEDRAAGQLKTQSGSRTQLQAAVCRHKKLQKLLRSQLSFVQHLSQREPDVLQGQEEVLVQVKARLGALLEQEVASEWNLQIWTCWEDDCRQLNRILDQLEVVVCAEGPQSDDEEEAAGRHKLQSCQQALLQLEESRAALGRILELRERLGAREAGGALALRWKSLHRRLEQEIRRCRDIQESQSRFLSHFSSVSQQLLQARKRLTDLHLTSDLERQGVCRNLVLLLDLCAEVENMSVQKAAACRDAARSLALRDADCPSLRHQRDQLEADWSQLTSDLWKTQEQLQQHLLLSWPPLELLSHLELWIQKSEHRLAEEREAAARAEDATQIRTSLQKHQELRASVVSGQLLLDFLTQSGPQAAGEEVRTLRSTRTTFAERVGEVRLTWWSQQRDVERQICRLEQLLHTCSLRERQLLRLQRFLEEQKKLLSQSKRLCCRAEARLLLQNWEVEAGGLETASAELQQLKTTCVSEEKLRCDEVLARRAESLRGSCEDLMQQAKHLRSSLLKTVDDWDQLEKNLCEVSLQTTRLRCSLQQQSEAPLLSLPQTEELIRSLQGLLEEAAGGEGLWARTRQSSHRLLDSLDQTSARTLHTDVEEEQERWSHAQQQLKAVLGQTTETLALWQDHDHLWHIFSQHLKQLRDQWRALWDSADPITEERICSLEAPAAELRSRLEPVLASSRFLTQHLDPLGAELVRSGSRLLSREVTRLTRAVSHTQSRLLEEQQSFLSQLEHFEGQMEKILLEHQANDLESAKQQLLQLCGLLPFLLHLQESSSRQHSTEALAARWRHSVARLCGTFSRVQTESLQSLQLLQKSRLLMSISENIAQMLSSSSDWDLQDLVSQHQKLGLDLMTGNLLLRLLLLRAADLQTEEERSQLLTLKETWTRSQALALQRQESTREQLSQWRRYRHGSRQILELLQEVDSLLPPDGAEPMTLQELLTGVDQNQAGAEALARHCGVLMLALQAQCRGCEPLLKDTEEAWSRTSRSLELRRDAIRSAAQKWTRCHATTTKIRSELDELRRRLCEPWQESEEETLLQDSEVSLHLLSCGLRDAGGMKADLSGYMLTGDSALLEQQLEQLHGQWEELCLKVSSRRQEIADRLSAWTIFNDKNKELCDWLTQMENKACQRGDLSLEEMVEKLKKDCMEEINLFSENKSHLKQLGQQLLMASEEAKQSQVQGSLQEVHQRWHSLFQHIEARVKKLRETLATVQQLDKSMSNLRAWLSRVEAELSRPVTYSQCHHQEIQRRLAEQQELQRDIEQHTEGVASVLSLCDVLLRDEDAGETEGDSLQETSRSLDQRWRTICALALDRRLRIEETWRLWCKFLEDYSRFEDWLKMAEVTAANPNSSDVQYTVAREELKKFEGFQRQVHERLTQLELVNNQYRRLARENRTDRASQIRAMVNKGNQRWDTLHRRVAAVLRRLKHFTSQREEFESTRESLLVWLTELDLQLTNVEHFCQSDVHHKIQQLSSFQREITVNTERIDGLIVFGEGLIQKSSPPDAALIEEELEELHSYCQEVFGRLVRFHQRLSQPPAREEPELSDFSLESSLELIGRPWLGRSLSSLPATPSQLLTSPLTRSGRETPVSVDSLPLEWDHTGDVGGSSSHEDEEDELDDEGSYFSTLSAPRWRPAADPDLQDVAAEAEAPPTLTSTPLKPTYLSLSSCCGTEDLRRVDEPDHQDQPGLTGLGASGLQSGVIERWELIQAQSRNQQRSGLSDSDLHDVTSWLEAVVPELERHLQSDSTDMDELLAGASDLKEMQRDSAHIKSLVMSLNLSAPSEPGQQERLALANRAWSRVCTGLQRWDTSLRARLLRCQEFHQSLHSLLLWLADAESRRLAVDIRDPGTPARALRRQHRTLTDLQGELQERRVQQEALHALWSQLRPEHEADDGEESQEKIHVTGTKLASLLAQVQDDLALLRRRLVGPALRCVAHVSSHLPDCTSTHGSVSQDAAPDAPDGAAADASRSSLPRRRERSAARSFFGRVLRAALPLHLLLLLLLLLPCLLPLGLSESGCADVNNFARSFHPMLRYTNGPPPT